MIFLLTCGSESQLPAHHIGIRSAKEVITDSTPGGIETDLNKAHEVGGTTNESQFSVSTSCIRVHNNK